MSIRASSLKVESMAMECIDMATVMFTKETM